MDFADLNEKFFDTVVVLGAKRDRYRAIGVNIRGVISRYTARRPSASSAWAQPVKQKGSSMKRSVAKKRHTASDMRAVSDNPEWTKRDFAMAKAFDEVSPTMRKGTAQ